MQAKCWVLPGWSGAGRTELLRLIAGVDRADAGAVLVDGQPAAPGPRARIRAGLGLVPEERKRDGIIRHRPVTTNIGLPAMRRFSRFGLIRKGHAEGPVRRADARGRPAPP